MRRGGRIGARRDAASKERSSPRGVHHCNRADRESGVMRLLVALAVIIYLVGVGVALAPTVENKWSSVPASEFATSVAQALPGAAAWPARAFQSSPQRG
jgi:hypothetical protein